MARNGMYSTGLYRNRYLIAVYDKDDRCIDVATCVSALKRWKCKSAYSEISRGSFFKKKGLKVYLIDCLEKHDDVFAEEDKIFLDEFYNGRTEKSKIVELASKHKVSMRTAYRHKNEWLGENCGE